MSLQPRLGPAALVVAPRLLLEVVGEVLEPTGPEPVEATLLAADDEDERAFATADERHERGEVEELVDPDPVRRRPR